MTTLAVTLEQFFLSRGYHWVDQNEETFIPTAEDLQAALDNIKETLVGLSKDTAEGEYPTLEAGRLYCALRDGHLDVYVHAGEIDLED